MHLVGSVIFVALLATSNAYAQAPGTQPPPAAPPVEDANAVQPPPDPNAATPPADPSAQNSAAAESPLSSLMQPYDYLDLGRKDPFQRPIIEKPLPPGAFHGPVLPLQKFRLDQLTLIGIIWDVTRPRAMLKDPEGKIHVLGPNAKIGNQNGYIAAIREGEVVVIETFEEEGKLRSDVRIVKLTAGKATADAR